MRSQPTPLAEILAARISTRGRITFAEYMESCLYHPEYGYYTRQEQRKNRDYFTSVDVTPVFGRLLARQFHEMWNVLERPEVFWLVEAGAGEGELAKQILDFASESLVEFYRAVRYVAVERSAVRRSAQQPLLATHTASGQFSSSDQLPEEVPCGCVFSNELLDSLPVHRAVWEAGKLREVYVNLGENGFCDELGAPSSAAIAEFFDDLGIALLEDQQAEVCLAARDWIEAAGKRLRRGFVLTIDYGHETDELYDERHMRGTLLSYERHRATEDFYRSPGNQDLTAHVNFTVLDKWGTQAGLVRTGFATQTNFLLALARLTDFADLQAAGASGHEQTAARLSFKTLIHPEGMGETFRVLGQHRGIENPRLTGFEPI